mmetsp:Transcript_135695/g.377979  ORF Transcript_135695/g.377979 Transcript_135695/m.377979 type:complete len:200 (-) Transcript_135695:16-615(-)
MRLPHRRAACSSSRTPSCTRYSASTTRARAWPSAGCSSSGSCTQTSPLSPPRTSRRSSGKMSRQPWRWRSRCGWGAAPSSPGVCCGSRSGASAAPKPRRSARSSCRSALAVGARSASCSRPASRGSTRSASIDSPSGEVSAKVASAYAAAASSAATSSAIFGRLPGPPGGAGMRRSLAASSWSFECAGVGPWRTCTGAI